MLYFIMDAKIQKKGDLRKHATSFLLGNLCFISYDVKQNN